MKETNQDEIDLGELIVKIKNSLFKNKLILIIAPIIGITLGVSRFKNTPQVFESEMIIYSKIIKEPLIEAIGESLNKIVSEKNYENLSKKLNITPGVASSITSIELSLKKEEKKSNDDEETGAFFTILINAESNENWEDINSGIINYLVSNKFVEKRKNAQLKTYQNLSKEINTQLNQIDSLKFNLLGVSNSNKGEFYIGTPSSTYETLINLYKLKLTTDENIELTDAIEVIDSVSYEKPVSAGVVKSAVIGFAIGFVISLGIVFMIELGAYIKNYEKTHTV